MQNTKMEKNTMNKTSIFIMSIWVLNFILQLYSYGLDSRNILMGALLLCFIANNLAEMSK